jgi:hypothetical protein
MAREAERIYFGKMREHERATDERSNFECEDAVDDAHEKSIIIV